MARSRRPINDLTDLIWEERRAKHARAVRLRLAKRQSIELLLRAVYPRNGEGDPEFEFELEQDISDIFTGVQVPQEGFKALCQRLGITNLDLFGLVYQAAAEDVERLQRMGDRAASRHNLALQLQPGLDMSPSSCSLVGSSPQRPGDDVGGLDLLLGQPIGDAADFLD